MTNEERKNQVYAIVFEVSVTNEDIDDIVTTAFEGGINYWCSYADADWDHVRKEDIDCYASELISRGYTLRLHDAEEDKDYELTRDKVINGIHYTLKNGYLKCVPGSKIDMNEVDAIVSDVIIQAGLFGDVIYG